MTKHSLALLATLALVASACERNPVAAEPGPSGPAAVASITSGPANPGQSLVFRSGYDAEVSAVDAAHDLVDAYYDPYVVCGGGNLATFAMQEVSNPAFAATVRHLQSAGELPVVIYRWSTVQDALNSGTLDCEFLTTQWLYLGTARYTNTDNNVTFDPSRPDSWGWAGTGNVLDPAGGEHHFQEHARFVVDPSPVRVLQAGVVITVSNP